MPSKLSDYVYIYTSYPMYVCMCMLCAGYGWCESSLQVVGSFIIFMHKETYLTAAFASRIFLEAQKMQCTVCWLAGLYMYYTCRRWERECLLLLYVFIDQFSIFREEQQRRKWSNRSASGWMEWRMDEQDGTLCAIWHGMDSLQAWRPTCKWTKSFQL